MKSAEALLACCVVGLACFIGGQAVGPRQAVHDQADGTIASKPAPAAPTLADSSAALADDLAHHGEEILVAGRTASPRAAAGLEDTRRRIATGMQGTYIDELLAARDSAIARWPERTTRPLRVFVQEADALDAWNPDFLPAVRDAFDTWTQAGIPVRFSFVRDSASADISVRFVDTFANGISGKTIWSRDGAYWLLSSDIQLAVTHPHGGTVTAPQMRAIALHEVGHLLGLDHTQDPDNIMSARVRVRELSDADKATVRLVYTVPAGSIKR
ncbi:matrixin family metalloprotease [Gemmatimonas sp.]